MDINCAGCLELASGHMLDCPNNMEKGMPLTLDDIAEFTWNFGHEFFLETSKGNFIWSDPDYPGGNNTICPFNGTCKEWLEQTVVPFGRLKGTHVVRDYCGPDVKIME